MLPWRDSGWGCEGICHLPEFRGENEGGQSTETGGSSADRAHFPSGARCGLAWEEVLRDGIVPTDRADGPFCAVNGKEAYRLKRRWNDFFHSVKLVFILSCEPAWRFSSEALHIRGAI